MKHQINGIKLILTVVAVMWLLEIVNILTGRSLEAFGLIPRNIAHSFGILTAPLIHGGIWHLLGNSLPLVILALLVHQTRQLVSVTLIVWLGSGIIVWLVGRHAMHIGASGLVLGYWGFLIANGWINHSIKNILLSFIALFIYGGLFFSLIDFRSFISFEGHIAGCLCGILAAYILKNKSKSPGESL